jgi:hypothetical protein
MDFSTKLYQPTLLPFEKQIIQLVGCTEEEYRRLAAEAMRRGMARPAGYEHIPDVRMDPLTISIISLVVGVATSAVSYLLAPKPKAPSAGRQATNQDLGSITGGNRFTPTVGFDSQAELANYGEPIPIIFGRYTGETGGILVSPRLVWSRMFSYGTQQGVKLLFVVGEQGRDAGQTPQGIDPPALEGIFLGNNALNAIYADQFAFYWKRNTTISGFSRVKAVNLIYGTRGGAATGDPEGFDDIFSCPTARSENDYGFSSAYSLSNNSEFGCYSSIPNGSGYRVNWRIVSIPRIGRDETEDDPGANLSWERIKISGNKGVSGSGVAFYRSLRDRGMRGIGRTYSRRMGVVAFEGQRVSDSEGRREFNAYVGARIEFKISAKQLPTDFYPAGVKVDDINSALNEERIAADDALQLGEVFMIGRTIWKVASRSLSQWRPEDNRDQVVTLQCIELTGGIPLVGVVSEGSLTADFLYDEEPNQWNMGGSYYPLQKVSTALVRNTRPCEVTEIGIKSRVYQRLQGLCNFQSLPTPDELLRSENNRVTLSSGSVSSYVRRASMYTIMVRPSGPQPGTSIPYEWQLIGEQFVVVGNQPTDIYNFIRIRHPLQGRYEFKLLPKNGADIGRHSATNAEYWLLNASASIDNANERSILSSTYNTPYGAFALTAVGKIVTRDEIQYNSEFGLRPVLNGRATTRTYPEQVSIFTLLPENDTAGVTVTSTNVTGWATDPNASYDVGRNGSFTFQLFGSVDNSSIPENGYATLRYRHTLDSNRWIEIDYNVQRVRLPDGHYSGQRFTLNIQSRNIVATSNNYGGVNSFTTWVNVSSNNPYRNPPGFPTINRIGENHQVTGTATAPLGREQAFYEELHGPARNFDFGYIKTTSVYISAAGGRFITLRLTSSVITLPNHWTGLAKFWSPASIAVDQAAGATGGTWSTGDRFSLLYTVSASNPFRSPGSQIGADFQVQSLKQVEIAAGLYSAERWFELQSQYSDVSFYGSLVEKSNSGAPEHSVAYVNEIVSNPVTPNYDRMTISGLAFKASRNFSNLDQIRFWLPNGVPVTRFHPDEAGTVGPSNLLCDLVFYLLTNATAGLGNVLNMSADNAPLVNTGDFAKTARFLRANKLFFDGALSQSVNLRQFVSDTAPYFLCNFVISDGKFSLLPALPTTSTGEISTGPVQIKQLFTAGNILEDSFELEYLPAEERKNFQAVVRYREEQQNQLPQERTLVARWADTGDFAPIESFDLTPYCTSRNHAALVAKFFLSIRKRVTHTIRFKTTPYGIDLAPGDYIRVVTEASPYSAARNGSISATGVITSATTLSDGQYQILYYKPGAEDVDSGTMTVSGGKVAEQALWGTLFTIREITTSQNVYMVEQLTLDEDGTVQVTASDFPCDSNLSSLLAQDVVNDSRFAFDA